MFSSNYETLLEKIEAIERHMISSSDVQDQHEDSRRSNHLKKEIQLLREEISDIQEKQKEIVQELMDIKEIRSSRQDNLTLMKRYIMVLFI